VFTPTVALAERTEWELNGAGVASASLSGNTPGEERKRIIDLFRAGKIMVLASCLVLTEGFDAPNVSCCIMARRAGHVGTYIQMVGRVLRAAPGKERALVVDLTGALHQHGMPTLDREYDLHGEGIKKGEKSIKPWQCPACGAFSAVAYTVCPRCGHSLSVEEQERALKVMIDEQEHKLYRPEDEPATPAQLAALKIAKPGKLTQGQADAMIAEQVERSNQGQCSVRQAKILRKYKVKDDITVEQANAVIRAIAACGWKRVPKEALDYVK
jgi:superfamily II DNA or RNA helicase